MASSTTIPFMIGGATVNEGSTLARFSLLAPEIRTGKLINCVGLRNETAARWKKTAGLMGGRWRGMRKIGGGSWSALCSKSGNKDSSADGGEKVDIDALTETLEKKSQKIMELHSGILKKLEERRNLIAEFKLIINTPVDEDTPADEDTSAQDSGSPPLHDLKSSDKKDLNNERDWASLSSSSSDQSPSGKAVEKSTTVSKAKMDVGSNNMEIVNKKDAIGSISSRNINSVPRFPEKSTTRSASTSKESGKKPKRSSSPQVFSKKFEDRPDVSKRLPNGVNERTDSLRPHLTKSSPDVNDSLEGIPELIAEEIRKSISAAAVSSPQEEKSIEPLFNEVISETNNVSHEDVKPPPLAGENAMNVILVAAECSPWKKTGGLGDVAGALPKALARRGHRVMVVVPRYGNYADSQDLGVRKRYKVAGQDMEVNYFHAFIDGVDFVFIESPILRHIEDNIYGGNWMDLLRRMTLFCKAAVEVPWHVPCGGICYGDGNLVFIANDWHTALLPVYLKAYYRDNGLMTYTRSILVIHNIAHQGRGPLESSFSSLDLPGHYIDYFKLYDPVGGEHCNIFAAGIKTADRVVAVSHGYAWELKTNEGGWGLHNIINENDWKLQGIVNGIDYNEWNPQVDEHLKSDGYTNYSLSTLPTGKAQCKAALQAEMGLPVRPDVPLIGFIGRLDGQKGVDIIGEAIPWMMDQDVQLVMLGTGRPDLEDMLKWFENQYKDKIRGWVGFSVSTAHRITAGVDILLMPSRFEPCGLNQLYAMCYGTIPVVHSVGGLRDTVHPYDPFSDTGYGWTFDRAECGKLIEALGYCLMTFRDYKKSWEGIQRRGMTQDLSWDHAAQIYEEVLVAAKYQW